MRTFVVWEIREKQKPIKIDTVKANTSESARRKAIIGTKKEYNNVRAYAFKQRSPNYGTLGRGNGTN